MPNSGLPDWLLFADGAGEGDLAMSLISTDRIRPRLFAKGESPGTDGWGWGISWIGYLAEFLASFFA